MTPERWQQIDQLFHEALACEPAQRAAFLTGACGDDDALRLEVQSLISSHESGESFIEKPAGDVAAEMLGTKSRLGPGQQISNYKIVRHLGSGGMGEVYLALDTKLHRNIALKLLPSSFTNDADRERRFEQEARAASALNHPNIVTIHEIGKTDSVNFIATEFVDGQTLREHIKGAQLSVADLLDLASQVVSALEAAHRAGIIHRDIKPENIMVRHDRIVKVLDFGLAKLSQHSDSIHSEAPTHLIVHTNPGVVMGTVAYMSPEQARGETVDGRTDIWSLGVVLYELLTGRVPFTGQTSSHVIVSILESEPSPPSRYVDVPVELERIILKSLSKQPDERYQKAREMASELKALRQDLDAAVRLKHVTPNGPPTQALSTGSTFADEARTTVSGEHLRNQIKTAAVRNDDTKSLAMALRRPSAKLLLAGIILASTLVGFYVWKSAKPSNGPLLTVKSIAVLPLENVSGDEQYQYIADGMTEALINELGKIGALRVISRTSVMQYKHTSKSTPEIARELNVDAIVEGSVLQANDRVRVTTQLIHGLTDTHLWAENYERDLRDVLALQSEIARGVAREIRIKLTPQEQQRLAGCRAVDPRAHEAYLSGLYYLNQGIDATSEDIERLHKRSFESFEQAIKLDPGYGPAYSALAESYNWLASAGFPEFYPKAKDTALKGIKLDDNDAAAHAALAFTIWRHDWNFAEAEREFKKAEELAPNSDDWGYAQFLSTMGRHEEALQRFRLAQDRDPLTLYLKISIGFAYFNARKYDEAIAQYKTVIELDPKQSFGRSGLGVIYALKGMTEESIEECQRALDVSTGPGPRANLAWVYAKSGRRSEAIKIVDELKNNTSTLNTFSLAGVYAALNDKDSAMAQLEIAYARKYEDLLWLRVSPKFDNLRSDARFDDLLRRIGFTK